MPGSNYDENARPSLKRRHGKFRPEAKSVEISLSIGDHYRYHNARLCLPYSCSIRSAPMVSLSSRPFQEPELILRVFRLLEIEIENLRNLREDFLSSPPDSFQLTLMKTGSSMYIRSTFSSFEPFLNFHLKHSER
jgi:hypothetical protein